MLGPKLKKTRSTGWVGGSKHCGAETKPGHKITKTDAQREDENKTF